jgi:hypothetical protein
MYTRLFLGSEGLATETLENLGSRCNIGEVRAFHTPDDPEHGLRLLLEIEYILLSLKQLHAYDNFSPLLNK